MPDTYTRIQTGTKATTLGTILILVGLAFLHPEWAFKLLILVFFIMLTIESTIIDMAMGREDTEL